GLGRPGRAGRGLGDLVRRRSPKPDLAPMGEEAALCRQDRGADVGDQSLEDLPFRVSYAYRGQDGPTPSDEPGRRTPATPPPTEVSSPNARGGTARERLSGG